MKQIIKLTESDLHNIVKESVNRILKEIGDTEKGQYALGSLASRKINKGFHAEKNKLREEGEIGGGGATNCVGINVGGAAGQAKNHIDAAPFSNKPLKQKHNLGNPTTKKANMVDMTPALDRTPGFSMGERVGGKKK